jgi:hypothetical protein
VDVDAERYTVAGQILLRHRQGPDPAWRWRAAGQGAAGHQGALKDHLSAIARVLHGEPAGELRRLGRAAVRPDAHHRHRRGVAALAEGHEEHVPVPARASSDSSLGFFS